MLSCESVTRFIEIENIFRFCSLLSHKQASKLFVRLGAAKVYEYERPRRWCLRCGLRFGAGTVERSHRTGHQPTLPRRTLRTFDGASVRWRLSRDRLTR